MRKLIDHGSVTEMGAALRRGQLTAVALTKAYLERIERHADLGAVIAISPHAIKQAEAADKALAAGETSPMLGIPVLVKDNIETKGMPTTAGSLFLEHNKPARDAPIIAALRSEGAVILGKTNLSEWANFRSHWSSSGWSAVGGQAVNPYDRTRSPCGSSSGSGVAVAARLAPVAIGTETEGSVVCPSHVNGLVGMKPTVGLLAQKGIVPISHSQDTAGPMCIDVRSAALLLGGMAGRDMTGAIGKVKARQLRLGILSSNMGYHQEVDARFNASVARLKKAGVKFVRNLAFRPYREFGSDVSLLLKAEFKNDLNEYFASLRGPLRNKTLSDLIAFNKSHPEELIHFPQDNLIASEAMPGLDDPAYVSALARAQAESRSAIDALLAAHQLDALIAPTGGPAWKIDHVNGDHGLGGVSTYPAVAGYPHITIPMGLVRGLPVGFSMIAAGNADINLLGIAAAVEAELNVRLQPVAG